MANINLLPVEQKEAESFINIQRRFLYGSIALIVLTGIITFAILGFFSAFASRRSELIGKVEKSAEEINSRKETEELVVVVKDKASEAQKILAVRPDLNNVFSNLSQLIPQGVYFTDIKFVGIKVNVAGKARTSADAAGLVSSLVSDQSAKLFSDVNMESLSSDEKGNYTFNLSLRLVGANQN